jgi:hypothetical protein
MSDIIVSEEVQKEINKVNTEIQVLKDYKISDNKQYLKSTDDLKKVKTKAKELTELRVSLTVPLDESKKRIMDLFRQPLEVLTLIEETIKGEIIRYTSVNDTEPVKGVTRKKIWKYRILDESVIPSGFWCVDEGKIREAMRNGMVVPGVEFYPEDIISVNIK